MRGEKREFDPTGSERSGFDPKRQKTPELAREPEKRSEVQRSKLSGEKHGLDLTGAEGSCSGFKRHKTPELVREPERLEIQRSKVLGRKCGLNLTGAEGSCSGLKMQKTPELVSVFMEALAVNNAKKLMSCLEPMIERTIRKAVSEALEHVLPELGPARSVERVPPNIVVPDGRNLQLHFKTGLSLPLFTGRNVEGKEEAAIYLALLDANTGDVVTSGPESSAQLDVVVLEGDFGYENDENWAKEEFGKRILEGREGKGSLLTGNLQVSLKEGLGTLEKLKFCDNSSWTRTKMFRLGLKVSSGFCEGMRIREAITESFAVIDHRGETYKKHFPPLPKDDIWRLKSIRMNGPLHDKLNDIGVRTVKDFLCFYARDPHKLRKILGRGMTDKKWKSLIEHAKTCTFDVFSADDLINIGSNQLTSPNSLNSEKVLGKKAYDNWGHAIECDGATLLGIKLSKKATPMQSEFQCFINYAASNNQASREQHVSVSASSSQPMTEVVVARVDRASVGRCDSDQMTEHAGCSNGANFTINFQDEDTTYAQKEQHNGAPELVKAGWPITGQELAPGQPSNSGSQPADQLFYHDEEMHKGLDSFNWPFDHDEEMHQLFYDPYMPSSSPPYQHCSPIFDFGEAQGHSSAKSIVGWLKIKAVMQWGIFVRRKKSAAKMRVAGLVELRGQELAPGQPSNSGSQLADQLFYHDEEMHKGIDYFNWPFDHDEEMHQLFYDPYMPSSSPPYQHFSPIFDFGEVRGHSSAKAIGGWLKIKAVMQWGIFVRRKKSAAKMRVAGLVELRG